MFEQFFFLRRALFAHRILPLFILLVLLGNAACSTSSSPTGKHPTTSAPDSTAVFTQKDPHTRPAPTNSAVLTQRGDNTRLGWNAHETLLNTGNVNVTRFGKRVAYPVDGKIYAQPLFVPNLLVRNIRYNVVIVATEHDSIYAFDADATTVEPPLWHTSFLSNGVTPISSSQDLHCPSISPEVGITGTPVIDSATRTLYAVAATHEGSQLVYRLHAVDITTGREVLPPTRIQATATGSKNDSVGGKFTFNARQEQMHMGLLLLHGIVYASFASYCDIYPFHGWILGYRASDLQQAVVYMNTPTGWGGGIWESATGLTADAAGNIYYMSGNGDFDLDTGGANASNSLVKLRPENGTLKILDYFTPFNQQCTLAHDEDFGSGAPLLLPGQNEIISIGKEGRIYMIRQNHLGGYRAVSHPCSLQQKPRTNIDDVIQESSPYTLPGGFWGIGGYWQGSSGEYLYTAGNGDHLKAWKIVQGKLSLTATSQASEVLNYPGAIPVVSSNTASGSAIVWLLAPGTNGTAVLRAYDASNLNHELYNSQQDAKRDGLQGYDNFNVPTVTNGNVFVGTAKNLVIFSTISAS
ncbi:MAG: hypothetical protein JO011_00360 [Ktedonobacteraceae bacterium]|nr:hypothetical protein [Ktedonobacteraceae bacterium]